MLVRFRISDIGFGISEMGPHGGHPIVAVGKAKHARGSSTQMIRVEIIRAISTLAFQDIDGKAQPFRTPSGEVDHRPLNIFRPVSSYSHIICPNQTVDEVMYERDSSHRFDLGYLHSFRMPAGLRTTQYCTLRKVGLFVRQKPSA